MSGPDGARVPPARVRCRAIQEADAPALVTLLARGFAARSVAYWETAIDRLMAHARALTVPTRGYVLEAGGELVGVLLLIAAADGMESARGRRCNVSSWYVDPQFRAYGSLLVDQATKRRDLTYVNISPALHTLATIEAQGYARYASGRVMVLPSLSPPRRGVQVRWFDAATTDGGLVDSAEADLLRRHVGYGCLGVVARTPEGDEPFLFLPWKIKGRVPAAILIYCRHIERFRHLAGPVGRFLLRRGMPIVVVDACESLPGIAGMSVGERSLKYAKGPAAPRTGDLTDTEFVMFGP